MTTSKKIVTGVTWTAVQTLINRTSGFIVKLILARLLFPEDYGLIGMAVVFTSFFKSFTDLGFSTAIIQRDENQINQTYLSTAFWANMLWSVLSFIILAILIAPLATKFYNEDVLLYLIPSLGLSILTTPLYFVNRSILVRELNFKKISHINNLANVIAGATAIIMAFSGFGVWALVAHNVVQTIIELPLFFYFSKWKPSLVWDKKAYKDLFGFTAFTTLSELINRLSSNGDYFIVGKLLGKIELGLYSFAFILTDSIRVQIKMIIDTVMYPVFSKLQGDKKQQENLLSKTIFYNCITTAPIMGLLFLNPELITIVFGDKWIDSLLVIKIIALAAIVQILTNSFPTLMRANGLARIEFNYQLIKVFILFLPLVFLGTYYYGIIGCSLSILFSRILQNILNIQGFRKFLEISPKTIFSNYTKGLLPTVLSIVLIFPFYYIIDVKSNLVVFSSTLIYVILIIIISYVFNKSELKKLLKLKSNEPLN